MQDEDISEKNLCEDGGVRKKILTPGKGSKPPQGAKVFGRGYYSFS
jgi:hypothetical protein